MSLKINSSISSFFGNNILPCIATLLGLVIVSYSLANYLRKKVSWVLESSGIAKKTDQVSRTLNPKELRTPAYGYSKNRFDQSKVELSYSRTHKFASVSEGIPNRTPSWRTQFTTEQKIPNMPTQAVKTTDFQDIVTTSAAEMQAKLESNVQDVEKQSAVDLANRIAEINGMTHLSDEEKADVIAMVTKESDQSIEILRRITDKLKQIGS